MLAGSLMKATLAAILLLAAPAGQAQTAREEPAGLEAALDAFQGAIADGEKAIREHPFYRDPENRAGAQAFLAAMTL